jgi:uncharacterized protein (TIGR00255 family)
MTGFARAQGAEGGYSWTWEIKSVNARGLDVRFRLPTGFDHLEVEARGRIAEKLRRGSLNVGLALVRPPRLPAIEVNREALDRLVARSVEVGQSYDSPTPRIELFLQVPGVLVSATTEESEEERARLEARLLAGFDQALARLADMRAGEGGRLAVVVHGHLDRIEALRRAAADAVGDVPALMAKRLREQIDALLGGDKPVGEDRLAQEIALLAAKADVREELDRLDAHIAAARELMAGGGAVGRRFDFLCQEFNREANTLCSKSADIALTRVGLDLKAAIEQLREQVQNIE